MNTKPQITTLRATLSLVFASALGLIVGATIRGPLMIYQAFTVVGLGGGILLGIALPMTAILFVSIHFFVTLVRKSSNETLLRRWAIVFFIMSVVLSIAGIKLLIYQNIKSMERLNDAWRADYGRIQGTWYTISPKNGYEFMFSVSNLQDRGSPFLIGREDLQIKNISSDVPVECNYEFRVMPRINGKDVPLGIYIECANWEGEPLLSTNERQDDWLSNYWYKEVVISDETLTLIPDESKGGDTERLILRRK
ncbi:MAG: hypothetical protein KC582_02890 [Candidatus Magasanikbacteria bacterium]|nr:hypothetical protein [Candidatus Magasanikbacteria bacterium]MCA9391175.1 hypothetical protein [Candidatus Magasanikbacteria bacterium]USN52971.1 MAG: hypothetical protein H6759_02860 [Candidatus Nomurabacteria bacterium]HPF95507.1 hypothetical protein [bacterium]